MLSKVKSFAQVFWACKWWRQNLNLDSWVIPTKKKKQTSRGNWKVCLVFSSYHFTYLSKISDGFLLPLEHSRVLYFVLKPFSWLCLLLFVFKHPALYPNVVTFSFLSNLTSWTWFISCNGHLRCWDNTEDHKEKAGKKLQWNERKEQDIRSNMATISCKNHIRY